MHVRQVEVGVVGMDVYELVQAEDEIEDGLCSRHVESGGDDNESTPAAHIRQSDTREKGVAWWDGRTIRGSDAKKDEWVI